MKKWIFILVQLLVSCTFLFGFWLDPASLEVAVSSGSETDLGFEIDSSLLDIGSYLCRIRITDSENGFIDIPVSLTVASSQLDTPQNPTITMTGDSMILHWESVAGASYYKISKALQITDEFEEFTITEDTSLIIPIPIEEEKGFYQIKAIQTDNLSESYHKESAPVIITYPQTDSFERTFSATEPPAGIVRNIAEFEQMDAVLIRYPFGIPISFIAELSEEINVITILEDQGEENNVISQYDSHGVNLSNCQFIQTDSDSYWTRDYGPLFITVDNQELAIVNFPYNRPRPNDNDIPVDVADYLEIPLFGMNLTHTGGNYMTDGHGISASSDLVLEENNSLTVDDVDTLVADYLGISNYHLIQDPNNTYIDHIDCWGKFLAPDKVLIRSVPTSHPQYEEIEDVVTYFETQLSSYNKPYQIYRVYTPDNQPYSNSLIINNRVFLPLMYSSFDDDAMSIYEEALPGYEIIGVYGNWQSTDALHCRTHEIANKDMVDIRHIPSAINIPENQLPLIEANINAFDGSGLDSDSLKIYYQTGNRNFESANIIQFEDDIYQILLPYFSANDTVYYYLEGVSNSGERALEPLIGAGDPHYFVVGNTQETSMSISPQSIILDLNQGASENINLVLTNNYSGDITINVKIITENAE